MLRTKTLRAVHILPAAFAIALLGYTASARADVASQTLALNQKLQQFFAIQEGKTVAQQGAYNIQTATADDLVFAVYELADALGDNPAELANLAEAALAVLPAGTPAAAKVRADKDKIVGRILEAVVVASSTKGPGGTVPTDQALIVNNLLQQLGAVNSTGGFPVSKQLTAAGKQLLIAKALRSTQGLGAAIAAKANSFIPAAATAAASDTARTTFTVAVLKLLAFKPITSDPAKLATTNTFFPILNGAQRAVQGEPAFVEGIPPSIFGVTDYVDAALDGYMATVKATAALNIAKGVSATVPGAAGATIAGYVKDLKTTTPATSNQDILNYLKGTSAATSIVANASLAAAVSDIVADTFRQFGGTGATSGDAVALATSTAVSITPTLKGKIASGAIRANPSQAGTIVNDIIALNDGTGKVITQTGIAAFAGLAAQGNSTAGAAITTASIGKLTFVPNANAATATKNDNVKIEAIAIAVGKSLALVDPNAVDAVAESLFAVTRNGSNPYAIAGAPGEFARQTLAANLAKGLATNYAAAGSAVAGVAHQSLVLNVPASGNLALDQVAAISAAAIKVAPKAAVDIALRVTASAPLQFTFFTGGVTTRDFAAKIAANPSVATANAGAVAAGVSLADTANAGLITAAVINAPIITPSAAATAAFNGRQAAALTIANTVAINVDVEAIGLIAKEVGALLQPAKLSSGAVNPSKLPKLTTIGTLATSLAKAINLKPLVTQKNRVDELSELAAELTNRYLANLATAGNIPDGVDATGSATTSAAITEQKALAAALASIGTSIFKSVSAKLLADTFNNAADVSDIAENVSGAIAQAIAHTSLNATVKTYLLTSQATGSLIKTLLTAATASKSTLQVTNAFNNVVGSGANDFVAGGNDALKNVIRADATVGRYENGANYETGPVVGSETPIKNI